jgi:uncharacterized SAM-binding protein YcdF (DUF218 family)
MRRRRSPAGRPRATRCGSSRPPQRRLDAYVLAGVAGALAASAVAVAGWAAAATVGVWRAGRRAVRPVVDAAGRSRPGIPPHPEAIVVFGATATASGPSAELRARLAHAADLWRAGIAPVILVSGGVAAGIDEVDAMTGWLVAHGVPPEAVLPGRPGANTRATVRTIRALGLRRVVAVSSSSHARRIEAEGRRNGLDIAVASPAATPSTLRDRTRRARFVAEVAGLMWYDLPPVLAARVYTGPGSFRHLLPLVLSGEMRVIDFIRGTRRAPGA